MNSGNFDLALIDAARGGDRTATRTLIERASHIIEKVCRRLSRGHQNRHGINMTDLRQDVLVFLFEDHGRVLARFDPERGSLETYLWRVAWNRIITLLRNRGASGTEEIPVAKLPEQASEGDLDKRIMVRQVIEYLRATLSELLWATFLLVFVSGLSAIDAARELNTSPSIIHLRIHKIRKAAKGTLAA